MPACHIILGTSMHVPNLPKLSSSPYDADCWTDTDREVNTAAYHPHRKPEPHA